MRRFLHAALPWLLVALLLATAGCGTRRSRTENPLGLRIAITPAALTTGPTTLTVTVQHPDGSPIDNAALMVRGDMSHAGMVPVLAPPVTGGEAGQYAIPFDWTMAGDWFVTVSLTLPEGSRAVEIFEFTIR